MGLNVCVYTRWDGVLKRYEWIGTVSTILMGRGEKMIHVTFSLFMNKSYSINLINMIKRGKKMGNVKNNNKKSFIYRRYYFTKPYTYFLVFLINK